MASRTIDISTAGTTTRTDERFDPRNNVVRYSRATYTATTDDRNHRSPSAEAVAQSVDRLSRPAE